MWLVKHGPRLYSVNSRGSLLTFSSAIRMNGLAADPLKGRDSGETHVTDTGNELSRVTDSQWNHIPTRLHTLLTQFTVKKIIYCSMELWFEILIVFLSKTKVCIHFNPTRAFNKTVTSDTGWLRRSETRLPDTHNCCFSPHVDKISVHTKTLF